MLTDERQDVIRSLLAADGRVLANDLAQRFGVSEDTVRRDLRELARAGACRRVHGGALPPAPNLSLAVRNSTGTDLKARLAATAAELVAPRQTLFIDAGSTNVAIARALPAVPLTVVTNAPAVLAAFEPRAGLTLVLLGGIYDAEHGSTGGPQTLREIDAIHADLFFLGGCAVGEGIGVSAFDPVEAETKRAMRQHTRATAVAATDEKLGTAASFRVAAPSELAHLIIAAEAEADLSAFTAAGTTIHRAA